MKSEYIPFIFIPLLIVISGILAYILQISMTVILFVLIISIEIFCIVFDKRPDGQLGDAGQTAKEIILGTILIFLGIFIAQFLVKYFF